MLLYICNKKGDKVMNRYKVIYLNKNGERAISVINGYNCKDMLDKFYLFRSSDIEIISIKNLGKGY